MLDICGAARWPAALGAAGWLSLAIGCSGSGSVPEPSPADTASRDKVVQAYLERARPIFAAKCFVCHHSAVEAPWYASIPVVGRYFEEDIEHGLQLLDFSNAYPFVGDRETGAAAYLFGLRTAMLDDTMPPTSFLVTHPLGFVRDHERTAILEWVDRALDSIDHGQLEEPGEYAHVMALVSNRCARCHRSGVDDELSGEFTDVTDLEWLVEDGEYIDPDDFEASTLYEHISGGDEIMPPSPNDRLTDAEVESIANWIESGAEIDE